MAPSVWLAVLEKLDAFALDVVVSAMRTFADRYADGQHDERYLLGIVRGENRKSATAPRPLARLPPAQSHEFPDGWDEYHLPASRSA